MDGQKANGGNKETRKWWKDAFYLGAVISLAVAIFITIYLSIKPDAVNDAIRFLSLCWQIGLGISGVLFVCRQIIEITNNTNKMRESSEEVLAWHIRVKTAEVVDVLKYIDDFRTINNYLINNKLETIPKKLDEKDDNIGRSLINILNYLEGLAIGIDKKIYDRDIIHSSLRSTFTRTYVRAKDYINERHKITAKQNSWVVFEALAKEWDSNLK
jgi:hypothetical protein